MIAFNILIVIDYPTEEVLKGVSEEAVVDNLMQPPEPVTPLNLDALVSSPWGIPIFDRYLSLASDPSLVCLFVLFLNNDCSAFFNYLVFVLHTAFNPYYGM